MLRETAGKVVSIGHLHCRLAEQPHSHQIELGDYLIECCATLISSLALAGKISIAQRMGTDCSVKADTAQRIGLFVNEVIMNAVKHAHPTGLPVEMELICRRIGDNVVIDICDDGVGLPEDFDATKDGGVGFNLIRTLSDAVGGRLEVHSDSLGTSFCLQVPAEQTSAEASNVTPIAGPVAD
jgi:two-component sensor histidine kinase